MATTKWWVKLPKPVEPAPKKVEPKAEVKPKKSDEKSDD